MVLADLCHRFQIGDIKAAPYRQQANMVLMCKLHLRSIILIVVSSIKISTVILDNFPTHYTRLFIPVSDMVSLYGRGPGVQLSISDTYYCLVV